MNSFNRKIAEKFGPQRAKPKKFGCLGNFLHGALRPCIFIARHPEGVNHTPLAYSAYTPRSLKDSSTSTGYFASLRATGKSASPAMLALTP